MAADFHDFSVKLASLVSRFDEQAAVMRSRAFDEATLRLEFLDPMFAALGWNVWNDPPQPLHLRDVVVENRVEGRDHSGKADYVFRTAGLDRWVCEAKRPFDAIERHFFQVQNYTYNMRLWLGTLCSFENLILFVVGGKPSRERPFSPVPGWRLHYTNYVPLAGQIWDLLSSEAVHDGSIERFIQGLGKAPTRARQGWLIKPDRNKTVDAKFLSFLEDQRKRFAKEIIKSNPQIAWFTTSPAECLQDIFDRILFQRISEDRGIDVGRPLARTLQDWLGRGSIPGQLWPMMVANFRHLAATFNGGVYGRQRGAPAVSDELYISDTLLVDFIEEIAGDESEWLFGSMPLWLLGSVYERFLGSEVQASGNVELKLQARKAGGVYYTPEAVVREVVDKTLGELLRGLHPRKVLELRVIDPACGSGSFLLTAFDRMLDHCLDYYLANQGEITDQVAFWVGEKLLLTTSFKRRILTKCIFGIDIDPVAIQVAQMSLCLRVLEDETQQALSRERTLFPRETFLPSLDGNIIHANSLLPTSAYPEHVSLTCLESANAVDWDLLLSKTPNGRGFDAVIGNPPWGADVEPEIERYLKSAHREALVRMPDTYIYFTHLSMETLLRRNGLLGLVLPGTLLNQSDARALRNYLLSWSVEAVADLGQGIFGDALNTTSILVVRKSSNSAAPLLLNDTSRVQPELRDAALSKWAPTERDRWEAVVAAEQSRTFFAGGLIEAERLQEARSRHVLLADVIDDLGIQRGVTPDVKAAHILTTEEAAEARIEPEVLRNSLTGPDIRPFGIAPASCRIVYTTDANQPSKIPYTLQHLTAFRAMISCTEVARGLHPWWRLHRARDSNIFSRKKFIGITTSRKICLAWDESFELVVTDAMYVFAPKAGIPKDYLSGVMHSEAFARFYSIANRGDARVIPQIKATKLSSIPVPEWNSENKTHNDIVSVVQALTRLGSSKASGAQRSYDAQLRRLNSLVELAYFD